MSEGFSLEDPWNQGIAKQSIAYGGWSTVVPLQGVNINDKHIEIISRQMMRWMRIGDVGDTEFLIDEQTDKFLFRG